MSIEKQCTHCKRDIAFSDYYVFVGDFTRGVFCNYACFCYWFEKRLDFQI
jgi:hypothetical protein